MGKNSSIEWTHHTFNPWWGCLKVSQACKHCYAEAWARRVGEDVWGKDAPRRFFSNDHWRQPLLWHAEAQSERVRRRVFCASMADVFEGRHDLNPWRKRLWSLIEQTPWLDWLLLTKRPELISKLVPWKTSWPANIWLGTTTENQACADKRIPHLTKHPVACRFLSCEPLLGTLDLTTWLPSEPITHRASAARSDRYIDWVIAGGESGPQSRPMNPEWARDLRDQCQQSGTAFHFKQWGHWSPIESGNAALKQLILESRSGEKFVMGMLGKKGSGRQLDGRTWDEFPVLSVA